MKFAIFTAASAAALLVATPAQAVVTIVFTQGTTGVTVDVSGSIDPSSFGSPSSGNLQYTLLRPQGGTLYIMTTAYDVYRLPANTVRSFGTSSSQINGTGLSGTFAIGSNGGNNDFIRLPKGYVAGAALSASAVFTGATFASMTITPVDFSQSLGGGQTVDFVFRTAAVTAAVPEPATWAMMIAGFGLVGGAMRRRRVAVSFG